MFQDNGLRLFSNNAFNKPINKTFVLEVGCGAGGHLHYFRERGCKIKGIDLGSTYIDYGRTKYGLDLSVGQLSDITLDSEPDIIIYHHVLEHISYINRELSLIYRHLADDGVLYVEVPGLKGCFYHEQRKMDFLRSLHLAHIYYFTKTTLYNLMQKNGFHRLNIDNRIRSIFKKGDQPSIKIINDYNDSLKMLRRLELYRKFGFGHMVTPFLKVITFLRIYDIIRKIHRKINI